MVSYGAWPQKEILNLPAHVFLDIVTTGAQPPKYRITEIALIRFEAGTEVSCLETLVANFSETMHPILGVWVQKYTT